ncbi:threonine/serine exporter family protein [Fundicoccus culcitae]|uniref:Threonine/serine exporter family protein n=1 Tax=Fundicoccus culcitae TaxID=2969821 RepID=A0ABY5P537_9LACT|nr:threonine/serine exporter family protein [Fundicoccus culcitae]UUX33857.1 threonine/serine exporter family protein [Fundicoccus culcitae]
MYSKYKKIAETAALAGVIMLESHAESYRVEDTVRRMLATSGLDITEVVSTTTALYITLDDSNPEVESITLVRRISSRGNHLRKIYRVNNISRALTANEITIEEANQQLKVVDQMEYTPQQKMIATNILVVAFAILLGGNIGEVIVSIFAGAIVSYSTAIKQFFGMNDFIYGMFTTALVALIFPIVIYFIPYQISSDIIIISGLMPLYPGTAFTNGVRDTLKGDYNSGLARIADALVIALSLALGVVLGLSISGGVISLLSNI